MRMGSDLPLFVVLALLKGGHNIMELVVRPKLWICSGIELVLRDPEGLEVFFLLDDQPMHRLG